MIRYDVSLAEENQMVGVTEFSKDTKKATNKHTETSDKSFEEDES